ncbi:MAG: hypothetical protein EBU79_06355, partial [Betaproteobacteria bacterium]|nr:hypothetical protein [Betaproteobacteria bacterium]
VIEELEQLAVHAEQANIRRPDAEAEGVQIAASGGHEGLRGLGQTKAAACILDDREDPGRELLGGPQGGSEENRATLEDGLPREPDGSR